MSDPIIVNSSLVVPVGQRRNLILKHPSKTPMLVKEIRFVYRHSNMKPTTGGQACYNPFDALRVKVKACGLDLTDGDVPVMLLAHITDEAMVWHTFNQIFGDGYGFASVVWKMAEPMYLPRNGQITFDFGLVDDLVNPSIAGSLTDFTVYVALVGEALSSNAPLRGNVVAPFVTAWLAPTSLADGSVTADGGGGLINMKSGPHDLKNSRKYPMKVTHINAGAMIAVTPADSGGATILADAFTDKKQYGIDTYGSASLIAAHQSLPSNGVRIQIRDTRGAFVVRDPTPLGMVVMPTDRAWKMKTVLAPNNYFIVNASGSWSTGGPTPVAWRMSMALHGHHEIPIADLGVSL